MVDQEGYFPQGDAKVWDPPLGCVCVFGMILTGHTLRRARDPSISKHTGQVLYATKLDIWLSLTGC